MIALQSIRHVSAMIVGFVLTSISAYAQEGLAGSYTVTGANAVGGAYQGTIEIHEKVKAFELDWALDGGMRYGGLALELDGVLGAVYWQRDENVRAPGIVVYRIEGGKMEGIWLPKGESGRVLGREHLLGPAELEGRFEIILGEHPGGNATYQGYVTVARQGDVYQFHWYAPGDSFVGNGVRIGNVMVVGYALGRAPGTVAYCIHKGTLDGQFALGAETRLGHETLRRADAESGVAAELAKNCVAEMAQR